MSRDRACVCDVTSGRFYRVCVCACGRDVVEWCDKRRLYTVFRKKKKHLSCFLAQLLEKNNQWMSKTYGTNCSSKWTSKSRHFWMRQIHRNATTALGGVHHKRCFQPPLKLVRRQSTVEQSRQQTVLDVRMWSIAQAYCPNKYKDQVRWRSCADFNKFAFCTLRFHLASRGIFIPATFFNHSQLFNEMFIFKSYKNASTDLLHIASTFD